MMACGRSTTTWRWRGHWEAWKTSRRRCGTATSAHERETIEEHVTSAVWSTSPHLLSRSTPLQHLKGTRQERRQAFSVVSVFHELLLPPPQPPRRYFAAPLLQESRKNERERQRESKMNRKKGKEKKHKKQRC